MNTESIVKNYLDTGDNSETKLTFTGKDFDPVHVNTFEDLSLSLDLLKGIYLKGWEKPSDIQKISIQAISTRRDILLQAQSGMGKTGAYCIGLLNNVKLDVASVQGLIILNTK